MSFLPMTEDTTATKGMRLDDLSQKGKAATIGADSWALEQTSVHGMVQTHNESISALSTTVRNLEQQVKAIARVLSTQNVQKLTENMKLAHDDLKKSMENYVNDKQRDLMAMVEREVHEVMDVKNGLGKKIDGVETRLLTLMTTRADEANQARHAIMDEIEKINAQIEGVPAQQETVEKKIKDIDDRVLSMKKRFREMEAEHEVANVEQDKAVASMMQDVKTALAEAHDKLSEESKSLAKYQKRHEVAIEERIKEIHDMIDKEKTDRFDTNKRISEECYERVHATKQEIQKAVTQISSDIDRKIQPFYSSFGEIKQMIGEETTHREVAVQNLARGLAKERKDRDHDEERLVGMISACTQAVQRMQNRPVTS
eukprot:TRINITY_DN4262_c0_g1_i1.p1 TRINITY_DN4262_c0_g1~~TRINITY_DN4262_c0_g1_i1.p1  ORF type:complete len:371 (+),score=99.97 TRINITY_DN4262_c0_g1_i1:76-1188(+)